MVASSLKGAECILLAGGLGTRLRSVVAELPKCMAPVAGRPFIDHVIDYFLSQGIEKFILALGYKSEVIIEHVTSKYPALQVKFSIEDEPLGTGGAILQAVKLCSSEIAIVTNGDTMYKVDLAAAENALNLSTAACTLLLKPMENFSRYGVVEINTDNRITAFKEKQQYDAGLINGGVYLLHVPRFLKEDFPQKFSFEKEYLETLYPQRKMFGLPQDAYFIDIGIPEDFQRAQEELC